MVICIRVLLGWIFIFWFLLLRMGLRLIGFLFILMMGILRSYGSFWESLRRCLSILRGGVMLCMNWLR